MLMQCSMSPFEAKLCKMTQNDAMPPNKICRLDPFLVCVIHNITEQH